MWMGARPSVSNDIEDTMDLTGLETVSKDILDAQAQHHEAWLKLREGLNLVTSPGRSATEHFKRRLGALILR